MYFISLILFSIFLSNAQGYLNFHLNFNIRYKTSLNGFFDNFGKKTTNTKGTSETTSKPSNIKEGYKLEKISRKQNRDYEKEATERKINEKAMSKAMSDPLGGLLGRDKVSTLSSFKFTNCKEFPKLYGGWLSKEGGTIKKQFTSSAKSAINKYRYTEILFDVVPNVDEVAVGTLNNKKFRQDDIIKNLKIPDSTIRGGPQTLEFANLYWGNVLAQAITKKTAIISISGTGLKSSLTLTKNAKLMNMKEGLTLKRGDFDYIIVLSPCQKSHYTDAKKIADNLSAPVTMLNAPYSYIYDLGGGNDFELIYCMKRIPKGWIYRKFPDNFKMLIEGPDYEITQAKVFNQRPTLKLLGKENMQASAEKYGATGNDRIFSNRL